MTSAQLNICERNKIKVIGQALEATTGVQISGLTVGVYVTGILGVGSHLGPIIDPDPESRITKGVIDYLRDKGVIVT